MTEDEIEEVVSTYPYPIAGIFCRIATTECMKSVDRRLGCILDTAEAVTRFVSAIVLCLCRDHVETQGGALPRSFSTNFYRNFRRPSWGHWLHFTREGLKWLLETDSEAPLAQKLGEFFFTRIPKESSAAQALGRLLSVRNDLAHGREPAHYAAQVKAICEETYPDLVAVIKTLEFIASYNLTFVDQIEVLKRRRKAPDFRHTLVRFKAGSGDFRGCERLYATALESQAVILRQGDSGPYLDLDPLLIYEHSSGSAPDLFFYNGMKKPSQIEYVACKVGGVFESSRSARAGELAEEIQNLLQELALPEELADVE